LGTPNLSNVIAGLRTIAVAAARDHEWLATTTFGAGLVLSAIALVVEGLVLGDIAIAASSHADAAQIRLLFETSGVFGGPPALVVLALYLGAAGSLAVMIRILPRWLALVGWIGSVLVLLTAFSVYAVSDTAAFWSPNGGVTRPTPGAVLGVDAGRVGGLRAARRG
jgi:hypothetical protein